MTKLQIIAAIGLAAYALSVIAQGSNEGVRPASATDRQTLSALTWPEISDRDVPLDAIDFATQLKWMLSLWIPAAARDDLPLHIYRVSVLDHPDVVSRVDASPVFAVLALGDDRYTARSVADADMVQDIYAAVAESSADMARRILLGTPFALPNVREIAIRRADLAAASTEVASPGDSVGSFDDLYALYPSIRASTETRDP